MNRVYRYHLTGKPADHFLYTMTKDPDRMQGYAWDFDTPGEAHDFLLKHFMSTHKHKVEM
jgi:hypothetical protein